MERNENYLTNNFFDKMYEEMLPKEDLLNCSLDEIGIFKKARREQARSVLKLDKMSNLFHAERNSELECEFESMGIQILKYKLDTMKSFSFPVYYIKAPKPIGTTVLYLHGHDDMGIMGALLERYDKVRYHKMFPLILAKAGYDVIAPEMIGFGEAGFYDFPVNSKKISGCLANSHYLTLMGFSVVGFRVYQGLNTLDFMEDMGWNRNITAFGVSGGGMICQHLSALDERIERVIVSNYVNQYKLSTLNKEHCVCNYVPELLVLGESYQLLSLVVPRPLLAISGIWDGPCPKEGAQIAHEYIKNVYNRVNASNNFQGIIFDGKHEINEEAVLRWLKETEKEYEDGGTREYVYAGN